VAVVGGFVGAGLLAVGLFAATRDDGAPEPTPPAAVHVVGLGIEVEPVADDVAASFSRSFGRARVAIGGPCTDLLVAETPAQRNQGLRGVDDLRPFDGMLFVRDEPAQSSFTMAGTAMDLTVGWYDAAGAPLGRADMVVCEGTDASCPGYPSAGPWSFAVELPLGTLPEGALAAC
jgi:uncharacterized membrane protein (UPF0127 family)